MASAVPYKLRNEVFLHLFLLSSPDRALWILLKCHVSIVLNIKEERKSLKTMLLPTNNFLVLPFAKYLFNHFHVLDSERTPKMASFAVISGLFCQSRSMSHQFSVSFIMVMPPCVGLWMVPVLVSVLWL